MSCFRVQRNTGGALDILEIHYSNDSLHFVNEFLTTVPFDLYQLHLFHLVVKHRSFTRAAQVAGLTQSALTRQMQAMESRLGIDLVRRTTRTVQPTEAGEFLYSESTKLVGDVDSTLQGIRQRFLNARKVVRVGVALEVGLSYLPGFFHRNLRENPETSCTVSRAGHETVLGRVLGNELELGVLVSPLRLPPSLGITHRFRDAYTFITSTDVPAGSVPIRPREFSAWGRDQHWLLPEETSADGRRLRRWMKAQGWAFTAAMEFDDYDLILNLVSLGMGVGFVPIRALALFGPRRAVTRVDLPKRYERELVVVARRQRHLPKHLQAFIDAILF